MTPGLRLGLKLALAIGLLTLTLIGEPLPRWPTILLVVYSVLTGLLALMDYRKSTHRMTKG